jgi:hypothetical protein
VRRFQPSLYGGLFLGILSALPIVGAANYCCCLWVVIGGLLTVYLQHQGNPAALEASEALFGGLVAGLIGAVLYLVLSAILFSMSGDLVEAQIRGAIERGQFPPDVQDRLLTVLSGHNILLVMAAVTLPLYAVFGMLGALLGFVLFRPSRPPAPQS